MNEILVDKLDLKALEDGASKLMDIVESLNDKILERDVRIEQQSKELNQLNFLKTQGNVSITDTLTRMNKFTNV